MGTNNIRRTHLMEQTFVAGGEQHGYDLRRSSDKTVTWYEGPGLPSMSGSDGYLGWRLDLLDPNGAARGEMVAAEMRIRADRLIFTSMIPSDEQCGYGGEGWLIELSYLSGHPPSGILFDLNGDGYFTESEDLFTAQQDGAVVPMAANSKRLGDGVYQSPAILSGPVEYKFSGGGMSESEPGPEDLIVTTPENPGTAAAGRAAWLELQ